MKLLIVCIALFLLSITFSTYAHDGHSHQSTYAFIIHLLWLAPIFVGLTFLYSQILKQL